MAAPKKQEIVKVLSVYKDETVEGGFASAFGVKVIEIDKDALTKYGKVVDSTEPDISGIFESNLNRKAREILGL